MADATGTPLFTADDLSDLLGVEVEERRATVVESVVWGWVRPLLASQERPDPAPEELYAWALELGAIAHANPAGLSSRAFGDVSEGYASERRAEILELVRTSAQGVAPGDSAAAGPAAPRGCFPAAEAYPDPAAGRRRRGHSWTW